MLNTVFDDDVIIVIAIGIDSIGNFNAVHIKLSTLWTPTITDIGSDIDDLEGSKKSILYAFLQAIGINGIAKVVNVGNVFSFFRCGCHTNLCGGFEIFQNHAPAAFFLCGASMTLIYNDQVEEVRLEQLAEMFFALVTNQLLIQRKINLMRGDGAGIIFAYVDFVCNLFEGSKVLLNRLIHKDITVSKIQNFTLHTALE